MCQHLHPTAYLRAAVVKDLDVRGEGLVHDLCGHVVAVSQVPQQRQHLQQQQLTVINKSSLWARFHSSVNTSLLWARFRSSVNT